MNEVCILLQLDWWAHKISSTHSPCSDVAVHNLSQAQDVAVGMIVNLQAKKHNRDEYFCS